MLSVKREEKGIKKNVRVSSFGARENYILFVLMKKTEELAALAQERIIFWLFMRYQMGGGEVPPLARTINYIWYFFLVVAWDLSLFVIGLPLLPLLIACIRLIRILRAME